MRIIVFLGAPGAGKGTAAAAVAQKSGARHVSTGAMLRDALARQTPAGLEAKSYMESGGLVPDEVLCKMIAELLAESPKDATLLFDGFPRNESQAKALDELASAAGAVVEQALCIDVGRDDLLKRLGGRRVCPKCGAGYHVVSLPPAKEGVCDSCGSELITRLDDRPETIAHRLEVYDQVTAPVISWYEKAGTLRHIDGSKSAAEVADAVLAAIS